VTRERRFRAGYKAPVQAFDLAPSELKVKRHSIITWRACSSWTLCVGGDNGGGNYGGSFNVGGNYVNGGNYGRGLRSSPRCP
jgi:hypothetical protein